MIMNKKVYIKPCSKHTAIDSESMIAGSKDDVTTLSIGDENGFGDGGGDGENIPEAESKLFNWNSFDEF